MNDQVTLSKLYFGELEAYDEARLHRHFFEATFVDPISMSMDSVRNNNKFIIVGRKGAGKTAIQMRFAERISEEKGYLTLFFRFFDDMKPEDYQNITKTQSHISYATAVDDRKIFLNYDYRPVWERVFLNKLAVLLVENGIENKFTEFCAPQVNVLKSIFQGISKAVKINLTADMIGIAADIGIDLSGFSESKSIPIDAHNQVARQLLLDFCFDFRVYFFIDEFWSFVEDVEVVNRDLPLKK